MNLPLRYDELKGEGLRISSEGNKLELTFSNFDKLRRFLIVFDVADFVQMELTINSFGKCQGGCGQIFMGSLTGEMLALASATAKESFKNKTELIVHLCPICQVKSTGGLQELIDEVAKDKKRLL